MIWGENAMKFKLNAFSHTQKYSVEVKRRKSKDFLKGRTSHSQFLAIFSINEGKS